MRFCDNGLGRYFVCDFFRSATESSSHGLLFTDLLQGFESIAIEFNGQIVERFVHRVWLIFLSPTLPYEDKIRSEI